MTTFERAKAYLLSAAGYPGGKVTFGVGSFGYEKLYCLLFRHGSTWVMTQAIEIAGSFRLIDSVSGTEVALRWSGHFQHDVTWNEPVFFCHCCKTALSPVYQPPLMPGRAGFHFVTCETAGCTLAGHTFTDRSYHRVDTAVYAK